MANLSSIDRRTQCQPSKAPTPGTSFGEAVKKYSLPVGGILLAALTMKACSDGNISNRTYVPTGSELHATYEGAAIDQGVNLRNDPYVVGSRHEDDSNSCAVTPTVLRLGAFSTIEASSRTDGDFVQIPTSELPDGMCEGDRDGRIWVSEQYIHDKPLTFRVTISPSGGEILTLK